MIDPGVSEPYRKLVYSWTSQSSVLELDARIVGALIANRVSNRCRMDLRREPSLRILSIVTVSLPGTLNAFGEVVRRFDSFGMTMQPQ